MDGVLTVAPFFLTSWEDEGHLVVAQVPNVPPFDVAPMLDTKHVHIIESAIAIMQDDTFVQIDGRARARTRALNPEFVCASLHVDTVDHCEAGAASVVDCSNERLVMINGAFSMNIDWIRHACTALRSPGGV